MAAEHIEKKEQGVGASVRRNEDRRYLCGKGEYLADLQVPGMAEAFFLRSPLAHGRIKSIEVPEEYRDQVFFARDIAFAKPIVAVSAAKGFKPSDYPPLTSDKARFVGDLLAVCIASTRAEAEDIAAACSVDFDELPAVWDINVALKPDAPRVHDDWADNIYVESHIETGDIEAVRKQAAVTVRKSLRMGRHAGVSMECRGVLAHYDRRMDELVVYSSTQFPHVIRTIMAECLGISESKLRVIAPDVGGGFGPKNNFQPEELAIAALSMKLNRPLRWVEDRREHFIASPHAREHRYELTAYADAKGRILGLEAEVVVDAGAYSVWPWTASMEAGMSAGIMTGPYDIPVYHARAVTVATNKSPLGPYRGVGRSGACFAIETLVDAVARAVNREPADVRIDNMVPASSMPYSSATHKLYDSGDYPQCAIRAREAIDIAGIRARQQKPEPDGRLIGIGMASYTEQSAHGTAEWVARGLPVVFGYEPALARLTPDGKLVLSSAFRTTAKAWRRLWRRWRTRNWAFRSPTSSCATATARFRLTAWAPSPRAASTMAGGAVSAACTILRREDRAYRRAFPAGAGGCSHAVRCRVHHGDQGVTFADIARAAYPASRTPAGR